MGDAVSTPPADDERIPPLTAQQLGLCGPLSDDPGVGPDAARHTPPADDQTARAEAPTWRDAERLIYEEIKGHPTIDPQTLADHIADMLLSFDLLADPDDTARADTLSGLLRGMARRVGNLRKNGRHFVGITEKLQDRLDSACIERDNLQTELSDLDRLRRNHDALADAYVATREALDHARATSREAIANRDSSVNRLLGQVAAVRALADQADEDSQKFPRSAGNYIPAAVSTADLRAVLDGPDEAPAEAGGYMEFYSRIGAVPAGGPAEAAEPAPPMQPAPAMTAPQILARLSELDAQAEANPDPRPLGDPIHMVGRYPVRAAEVGAPEPAAGRHAVYVRINDLPVAKTISVIDEVNIDFDAGGQPVGVEVLDSAHRGVTIDGLWAEPVGAGPTDAGLCPECGSEPDPTPLVTRPDMVECQHRCGAWVRPDADPAVTSALDWWHRRVREEEARRLASDTAAHRVLTEWSRMHPSGYLAMYPAMDALRAAVAAPRPEPVLIGTWADPEFQAHADHKHAVDGCGFCPSEEDR